MSTGPLYALGGAHPNALTGLATGLKRERKQDILTPQVVVDFLHAIWGGIALDPCATRDPRNLVDAANKVYGPWGPDFEGGLDVPWVDRTYCNPPYKDLKRWLAKAINEIGKGADSVGCPRIALLGPTRGHREWWQRARETVTVALELKPLTFVGYPGAFPAPLSLWLWHGVSVAQVRTAAELVGLGYTKIATP